MDSLHLPPQLRVNPAAYRGGLHSSMPHMDDHQKDFANTIMYLKHKSGHVEDPRCQKLSKKICQMHQSS
jgi:hypothetical protein